MSHWWRKGMFIAWCALGCPLIFAGASCGGARGGDSEPEQVATVESAVTSGTVKINCGGPAVSPFIADTDFSGGSTKTRTNTIDLSAVSNPAPVAVYQSQRYGNMTYTVPGFTAGSWNRIRLHFADTHWTTAGARLFNVTINGIPTLKNFDIIRTVGAGNKALVESFTMPANSNGKYVIQFTTVKDAATISGIEVAANGWAGTPTTASGTAYATQCAQQLVPLPPDFGGGGTCVDCFPGSDSCVGCTAGAWSYAGQLSNAETQQSFNGPDPVEIFYWEAPATSPTPGLCMAAARSVEGAIDFFGVICQAASGAVCFWDEAQPSQFTWTYGVGTSNENGHLDIPSPAKVITSTSSLPISPAFVGGAGLIMGSSGHTYQNVCSDCHSGRNAFNNHPGTATDLNGRHLVVSPSDWFPAAWPAPIVPAWDPGAGVLGAPWAENPGPQSTTTFSSACFNCHQEGQPGGLFPKPSSATVDYCFDVLLEAATRLSRDCPGTYPWSPTGAADINCPTGAMPAGSAATLTSSVNDGFVQGMVAHQTGQCFGEFRTQLLPPPGGGTLQSAPGTLSTVPGVFTPSATFGVSPAGKVMMYDSVAAKWITTNAAAAQVSVSALNTIWAIKQVGTTSFVCATDMSSCSAGSCAWTCDSQGHSGGYAQIAAGTGQAIWALDAGKHVLFAYFPTTALYTPDGFIAMGEWPIDDPIAQVTVGVDGDMWVLSANGNISRQSGGPFNGAWTAMPAPPGAAVVSLSAANADDVWAASSTGLYRYLPASNSWERHCLSSGGCSASAFKTVVAGGQSKSWIAEVWALDATGNAYRVDRTMDATTNSIFKIPGATLTNVSVGMQGDVMGISSNGTVYTFQ